MSITRKMPQKIVPSALALFMTISLSACAGMNDTEQRILTGAAIGAGAGAGLGVVTGGLSIAGGAAIGAAAGAVTGLGIDLLQKD
jgi:hypothetical protein